MSLVDSSAWIELFRNTGTKTHKRLRAKIQSGDELVTTEPVAMELLAGARSAADRRLIGEHSQRVGRSQSTTPAIGRTRPRSICAAGAKG